jgi:hypothetical protein
MKPRGDKGRLPPFVPLLIDTLDQPAWRAMSHGAQVLYIALRRRYSPNSHNNGRIFLSQRMAATELRSHHKEIGRWFRELQHYGFIVMSSPGCLGVNGKGRAPSWRLTELGCMKELPTRDYAYWNGTLFDPPKHRPVAEKRHTHPSPKKTESRGGKAPHPVAEKRHTSVAEKQHTSEPDRGGKVAHRDEGEPCRKSSTYLDNHLPPEKGEGSTASAAFRR